MIVYEFTQNSTHCENTSTMYLKNWNWILDNKGNSKCVLTAIWIVMQVLSIPGFVARKKLEFIDKIAVTEMKNKAGAEKERGKV